MDMELIEKAWQDRTLLKDKKVVETVMEVIDLLDRGMIRVAEKKDGTWQVNQWIKKAIIMYFPISSTMEMHAGDMTFWDKIPTKQNYETLQVRCVPPAVARYGSSSGRGPLRQLPCTRLHNDAFLCQHRGIRRQRHHG